MAPRRGRLRNNLLTWKTRIPEQPSSEYATQSEHALAQTERDGHSAPTHIERPSTEPFLTDDYYNTPPTFNDFGESPGSLSSISVRSQQSLLQNNQQNTDEPMTDIHDSDKSGISSLADQEDEADYDDLVDIVNVCVSRLCSSILTLWQGDDEEVDLEEHAGSHLPNTFVTRKRMGRG